MATDDSGQNNQNGEPGPGAPVPEAEKPEDRANRMNAAKAFYRAMYAGEEVAPDDFGMSDGSNRNDNRGPERAHTGPCPNCARLEAQCAEFEKQKNEAENFYKRIAADFENYRRRLDREREEFLGLGIQKAVEQILPALDDMDRAKSSLQNVTDAKAMLDSLNLVFARFSKCLDATGVKQMEVLGEPFDPRLHEPVQEVETNEYPDGAVALELRRGYVYKDKVLRPALVNVASNPSGVVVPKAAPAGVEPKENAAPAAEVPAAAAPTTEAPATAAPATAAPVAPATAEPSTASPATAAPTTAAPTTDAAATEAVALPPVKEVPPPSATESAPMPEASQASSETKSESSGEPPAKKAIDKLKPTRTHTETQDLPVFNIEDISESLTADAESGLVGEPKPAAEGGTIYDITDVDVDDKPGAVDVTSDQ